MRFVDEHRDRFAVALLLRVLNIAESTYYQWVKQAEQSCDRDLVDLGRSRSRVGQHLAECHDHHPRALRPPITWERCTCRECHPGRSGGMIVFVEDATEAVTSVDVQVGEPARVGDRFG